MKLVLLPGNSPKNKEWIESIQNKLSDFFDSSQILYYDHWENDGELNVNAEISKLVSITDDRSTILAKSAGIGISLSAILKENIKPKMCIFVGLPLSQEEKESKELSSYFKDYQIPTLFIQEANDPFATFEEVMNFLKKNNLKNYWVRKVEGNDHRYLDIDEIKELIEEFLNESNS